MTNFFQQPILPSTSPAQEPAGFDLLRQMLMNKSFGMSANPYGLNPSYQGGASQVYTNGQNQGFNPYQNAGGRPPQGGMGGGMGQGGGQGGPPPQIMQFLQHLMSQMGQGGGQQQPMPQGGGAPPPMTSGAPPDRSRQGFDGTPRTQPMRGGGGNGYGGTMPNQAMLMQLLAHMRGGGGQYGGGIASTLPAQMAPGGWHAGWGGPAQSGGGGMTTMPIGPRQAPLPPQAPPPQPMPQPGGGGQETADSNLGGGMATPPAQSPDLQTGSPQASGNVPDRSRQGFDGMTHYDGDGCTEGGAKFDGDPYSGWQPSRNSTPQSIKPPEAGGGGSAPNYIPPDTQTSSPVGGSNALNKSQSGYDGFGMSKSVGMQPSHGFGNRISGAPKLGGASGGMRQLAPLLDQLRPSRGPSPAARIGKPIHGIEPGMGLLR